MSEQTAVLAGVCPDCGEGLYLHAVWAGKVDGVCPRCEQGMRFDLPGQATALYVEGDWFDGVIPTWRRVGL